MTAPRYRYALAPGMVTSRSDSQRHHVAAGQLAGLYGLPLDDCLVIPSEPGPRRDYALSVAADLGLAVLGPRYDGIYTLFPAIP